MDDGNRGLMDDGKSGVEAGGTLAMRAGAGVATHAARRTFVAIAGLVMAAVCSTGVNSCQNTASTGPAIANSTCLACHDGRSASDMRAFDFGPHAGFDCETCHGSGYAHVRNGGRGGLLIDNPGDKPFVQEAEFCGRCHQDQVDGFKGTAHFAARGANCNDCHDVHRPLAIAADTASSSRVGTPAYAQVCGDCHDRQVDDFALSVHAISDVATCGSCHNMHVSDMFTANPVTNSLCLQCHGGFQLGLDTEAAIDAHTGGFHPVDPAGSGASRCTKCHMPPVNPGNQPGGASDHTLFTVPPSFSNEQIAQGLTPSPNSCAGVMGCHDPNVAGSGQPHDVTNPDSNTALQPLYESIGDIP